MRIILQPAFVLHQRAYRETSLLVELLTQEYGRISLVARGVRSLRSRLRGLLQPFIPLLVSWQGNGELVTLITLETAQVPFMLQKNSLLSGLYLNELLIRVLAKNDPHPNLYAVYYQTVAQLAELSRASQNNGYQLQIILRLFEKKLLQELGYGLQLQYDVSNQPISETHSYRFHLEQGFELINDNTERVNKLFLGKSLCALQNEKFDDVISLQEIKRLMRLALTPLIGSKPLFSRLLFL